MHAGRVALGIALLVVTASLARAEPPDEASGPIVRLVERLQLAPLTADEVFELFFVCAERSQEFEGWFTKPATETCRDDQRASARVTQRGGLTSIAYYPGRRPPDLFQPDRMLELGCTYRRDFGGKQNLEHWTCPTHRGFGLVLRIRLDPLRDGRSRWFILREEDDIARSRLRTP